MPSNIQLSFAFAPMHRYLAAVSGGPDSLCLLDLMRQLPGVDVIVAHFNHKLRPEADAEAVYVRSLVEKMGLPFLTASGDVRAYAVEKGISIEEAARTLRYRFLYGLARKHGASGIVTAHSADDQVETVLMHLLRGTGMAGLRGIQGVTRLLEFDAQVPLIRPMLHIWRNEVDEYCREHGLEPVYDATNSDQSYMRNRIRHSLIPEMESYNPKFKAALLRMVRTVSEDYEAVSSVVDHVWARALVASGDGFLAFSVSVLSGLQPAILRQLFRLAIHSVLGGLVDVDYDTLQRAVTLLEKRGDRAISNRVDLVGGVYALLEGERIIFTTWEADLPAEHWPQVTEPVEVTVGEYELGNGWLFTVQLLAGRYSVDSDPWTAWLDADLTGNHLTVRSRQASDRFQPLGMDGKSIKMQDFFVNTKLPKRARARWPLVCVGDAVAWVPGYRPAHPFRVTDKTKRVLKLVLKRLLVG